MVVVTSRVLKCSGVVVGKEQVDRAWVCVAPNGIYQLTHITATSNDRIKADGKVVIKECKQLTAEDSLLGQLFKLNCSFLTS